MKFFKNIYVTVGMVITLCSIIIFVQSCGKTEAAPVSDEVELSEQSQTETIYEYNAFKKVQVTTIIIDGIEYKIFHSIQGGVAVVNHTKEKMHVESLKR